MFIIWGFRRRLARLGVVFVMCASCHTPAAQSIVRVRRWFTLFFIPIIPLGTKYHTTCTMCGKALRITPETASQLIASIQNHQSPAAGQHPQVGVPAGQQGPIDAYVHDVPLSSLPPAIGAPPTDDLDDIQITLRD